MVATNPYQAPGADLAGMAHGQASGETLTSDTIDFFVQTRPWVLFLAILGFISVGLIVLAALFSLVGGIAGTALGQGASEFQGLASIGMAFGYLIMAALYFPPAWYLAKYASALGRVRAGRGAPAVEEALAHQMSFWRFLGIMMVIAMALYAVILIVAVIAAIVAA